MDASESARQVEDIIRRHLDRLVSQYKNQPGFAFTETITKRLLKVDALTFTLKAMIDEQQEALQKERHLSQSRKFSDLCLIISVVPALGAIEARTYFQGNYLGFLENQVRSLGAFFGQDNIAHWVLCSDGNALGVHLTIIPGTQNGLFVFAQDMLSDKEKAGIGLV